MIDELQYNFGEWGENPINQPNKTLKQYGFTPIGGIRELWQVGLSTEVLLKLAKSQNVETKNYSYTTESGEQIHRAFNIKDMGEAINKLIDSAYSISPKFYKSPLLDQRFMIGNQ